RVKTGNIRIRNGKSCAVVDTDSLTTNGSDISRTAQSGCIHIQTEGHFLKHRSRTGAHKGTDRRPHYRQMRLNTLPGYISANAGMCTGTGGQNSAVCGYPESGLHAGQYLMSLCKRHQWQITDIPFQISAGYQIGIITRIGAYPYRNCSLWPQHCIPGGHKTSRYKMLVIRHRYSQH